ncbi:MAG: class IV adenylate cyclase [Candidatus Bathyarchaeia archaeon]|jgi:adenylate cyclase class 2
MEEIEVKILNVDGRQVEEKLIRLGAKKVFDGEIESLFFDFEDSAMSKAKNVVRLRREDNKTILTFKKFLSNKAVKDVEEIGVVVSDMAKAKKILEFLGLSTTSSTKKDRLSYSLGQVHFDIDKYKGEHAYIPEFLEIEAEDADTIHKYAKLLGFSIKDCLPWSTEELVSYYSRKTSK